MPLLQNAGKEELDNATIVLHENGSIKQHDGPVSKALLCRDYGLEHRDVRTLDVAVTDLSPTLLCRKRSLVYTSSLVRAIIAVDHICLFTARNASNASWYGQDINAPMQIAQSLKTTILLLSLNQQHDKLDEFGTAFELRALEALLLIIVRGYSFVLKSLRSDAEAVTQALANDVSGPLIRELSDCRGRVEEYLNRINGFRNCLGGLLREDNLCDLYLTARVAGCPRPKGHDDEVELICESVLQRADEICEIATGLKTKLDATDSSLTLSLSATRNKLLRLEISIALAVFSLGIAQTIFSLFGMNLPLDSIFHDYPHAFWIVCGSALLVSAGVGRAGFARLAKLRRSHLHDNISKSRHVIRS